ncbi:hypothetical protein [Olleya sp. YS]|uniref:hypothetical protein n=1 Tax=Olleya sp. YS TaxID=3028318 RepID=UPI0024340E3B|nr:hypothetical protein [Olleya sp. YS]WGD35734.1 hypothetical protein Ollyesu_04810 [Olleya sp. YS]
MKPTITINVLLLLIITSIFSCKPSQYAFQKEAPLQITRAYFNNWTTGVKIGSVGVNIYFANLIPEQNITIDSVYFRRMKGKLHEGKGLYKSRLTKRLTNAEDNALTTTGFFPFKLGNRECAISYIENGVTKYYKVEYVAEKEGVYYPDGPPND